MNLEGLTEKVFENQDSRSYADQYLTELRENLRQISSAVSRSITLLVIVAVVFELLARAAISKASIGPFEISDLSLVRKALPLLFAYLFYDLCVSARLYQIAVRVHIALMRIVHPRIERNDLDILLLPRLHSLDSPPMFGRSSNAFLDNFIDVLSFGFFIGLMIFEGYAFYRQFSEFGTSDVLVWITLVLSLVFVVGGWVLAFFNPGREFEEGD